MPIPQVNDRIKEAPVVMLRAVFAGIGQILLTADKVRARAADQAWTPDHAPAGLPVDRRPTEPPRNGSTRTEPAAADQPAVREAPASQGPVTAEAAPATKTAPAAKATPAPKTAPATRPAKTTPAARPAAKATRATSTVPAPRAAKAEPAAQAPPLPGYDDLSLASLRARLRVLDAATIQAMLAYEKAHARREPVVTMLERRLAKISAG